MARGNIQVRLDSSAAWQQKQQAAGRQVWQQPAIHNHGTPASGITTNAVSGLQGVMRHATCDASNMCSPAAALPRVCLG